MKRWQTKNDRLLIGGLFLLIFAGSLPWTENGQYESGVANLSQQAPKAKETKGDKGEPKAAKKKIVVNTDDSVERDLTVDEKHHTVTYRPDKNNPKKTVVEIAPDKTQTEGVSPCDYCGTIVVGHPFGKQESTIKLIDETVQKLIEQGEKEQPKKLVAERKPEKTPEKEKKEKADSKKGDPILAECKEIHSKDKFTFCAMDKLAELANITGNDSYDAEELERLFQKHIAVNLEKQLRDGKSPGRQQEAQNEITDLMAKLDEINSEGLVSKLTKMQTIPAYIEANNVAQLSTVLKTFDKDDPRYLLLQQELMIRRSNLQQMLNNTYADTADAYSSIIDSDRFPAQRAYLDLYQNFAAPMSAISQAVWSDDPYNALKNLGTPNITHQNMAAYNAQRGARDQMGRTSFNNYGPKNYGPNQNNFPNRGNNSRGLPQSNGPGSRFAGSGQDRFAPSYQQPGFGPNRGYQQPGNYNTGVPPRFGAPGNAPTVFGTPNFMAPNQPATVYNGYPYGVASPGYQGGPGAAFRSPVINGGNYPGAGYSNTYRPGLAGAYPYQTNAFAPGWGANGQTPYMQNGAARRW
jgi:hypothetical protein